jgi:NADH-quinone oxidoreductase subunit H
MTPYWLILIFAAAVTGFVVSMAAFLSWVERKQSAVMQDRIGANRAAILGIRALGLFHAIADPVKLLLKEDFVPRGANRFFHTIAPWLSVTFALLAAFAIPFGDHILLGEEQVELRALPVNVALLFVFAAVGMGVYGVIFGAWASNNKFALMGGLRATAQVLSYEIALGLSVVGVLMVYGSLDLQEIVRAQGHHWFGWIPAWGIVTQPLAAILFLTAAAAETKRCPFDMPEGESEIIGYFTEYSSLKFAMFMMTDFIESVVVSGLFVSLFLGGWQVPWLAADGFHLGSAHLPLGHVWVVVLQIGAFVAKTCFLLWLLMTVRWTLPRFRYDQLMRLGWKNLFPLALLNVLLTGLVLAAIGR